MATTSVENPSNPEDPDECDETTTATSAVFSHSSSQRSSSNYDSPQEDKDDPSDTPSEEAASLSPWLLWLIEKEIKRRDQVKKGFKRSVQNEDDVAKISANLNFEKWLQEKNIVLKELKFHAKEIEEAKREKELLHKENLKAQSAEAYRRWMEEKASKRLEETKLKKEKEKEEAEKMLERKQSAEVAYEKWLSEKKRQKVDAISKDIYNGSLQYVFRKQMPHENGPNTFLVSTIAPKS